jgi:hypothetical protein
METIKNVVASVNEGVANLAQSTQEAMGTVHDKVDASSLRAAHCAAPGRACCAVSTAVHALCHSSIQLSNLAAVQAMANQSSLCDTFWCFCLCV